MAEVWILIEVEDSILNDRPLGEGVKWQYMVSPRLKIIQEDRSEREISEAAYQAGFELMHCNSVNHGVAPWVWSKIEMAVYAELRRRLGKNIHSHAVSINSLVRLTKY